MNVNKIAVLGVALVAGAAAFFLLMGNRQQETPVQIAQPVQEATVHVLVAMRDINRGERLTPEDTQWIVWPKKAVQPTFITDENPARREELSGAVARSLIVMGEPLVEAKVVKAGSAGLMAAILAPGMRAVTIRVAPETSSGGFILPGDRVDIHYTEADPNDSNKTKIFNVKENVRVLAVNTVYTETSETPVIEGKNLTLEMTPDDAEYLMIARNSKGTLQATLRSIFEPEEEQVAEERVRSEVRIIRYGRS